MSYSLRRLLLAALLAGLSGTASAMEDMPMPAPLALRSSVLVEDSVIRLGDLFDGALKNGDTAVARAPAPGASIVLDARWLSALARTYSLPWQPDSRFAQVAVGRASQRVGASEIRQALAAAAAAHGIEGPIEVALDASGIGFHLPVDVVPTVKIQKLALDRASGRFAASVVAPADGPVAARATVSGRIFALVEVPVPVRRLAPGEVIREADLEWSLVRADRVTSSTLVDPERLAGKSPRRPLHPGHPIRKTEVERVILVEKGSIVTMVLQNPNLSLTVKARAMQDGAEGDLIRMMNTDSNRIIHAMVVDSDTAVVTSGVPTGSN
ncbi:flagellar basal body P-ring formation chaperone FlgA [Rhodospirillaceae bacterium SYSU D60014]|uniref:flagellar basal body P-ring formation chaperone FlgA n=1 Tax=Virgifigura deserti TaxID=2268457 RepID=UPI000E66C78F